MLILSNRGELSLPDRKQTRGFWDNDKFNSEVMLKISATNAWMPFPYKDASSLRTVFGGHALFIFGGYNQKNKGWDDAALDAARVVDSTLLEMRANVGRVAGLWPCRGQNVLETIEFAIARKNASTSAAQFAPCVSALLSAGVAVSLMGHSCGGYIAYLIAARSIGRRLRNVVLMNAAMRQSEWDPSVAIAAEQWLCFHSTEDKALRTMQLDFIDEAGSNGFWGGILNVFRGKNKVDEPIVGMHGIPQVALNIENVDVTEDIGGDHSAARYVPDVMDKVAGLFQ